jgi:hypothetical protein
MSPDEYPFVPASWLSFIFFTKVSPWPRRDLPTERD